MATVQLVDAVDVEVFDGLPALNSTKKTAFLESGVVVRNPMLDGLARAAGDVATLPFWNDIDSSSAPNISNDDPSDIASTDKVTQGKQRAYTSHYNKAWQAADLVSELALGADAIDHIRARSEKYWSDRWTDQLVSTTQGVLADNVANNGSDMVTDVASEDGDNATASNKFSATNLIDAAYTMGDMVGGVTAIAAHSQVVAQMAKEDKGLQNVYDSDGTIMYRTYNEMRVIMDDSLPTLTGGISGVKYVTVIFGLGAFGNGEGMARVPTAIERNELAGNGGGVEALVNRKAWLLHPYGYEASEPAGNGYTNAELESAATWSRVVPRKNVPMAFLITN